MAARTGPARRARGIGLIDALIALAILSFGLLAMTRFQGRVVGQVTEAQSRMTALQLSDELLNTALVDVGNAACYTLPASGGCGNAAARARTDEWADRVAATLPGEVTARSTIGVDGRLTVAIQWTGHETRETRALEAVTDVRP